MLALIFISFFVVLIGMGFSMTLSYGAAFIVGFSRLSATEFFVFRKTEAREIKNHLLCGWCSKCL